MKTLTACLAIVLVAMLIGSLRQPRLSALKLQADHHLTSKAGDDMSATNDDSGSAPSIPTRRREKKQSPSAALDFYIAQIERGKGMKGGVFVAADNREAFAEIIKLDLKGMQEFIRLAVETDGLDQIRRCEAINLCLCAMADRHPEEALDYLLNSDERIGKFYAGWSSTKSMVTYATVRLADVNPVAASEFLIKDSTLQPPAISPDAYAKIIATMAERQPELAFETINQLPKETQHESWRTVIREAQTKEQCTHIFNAIRQNPIDGTAKTTGILSQLFKQVRSEAHSWNFFTSWLDDMKLSEQEKLEIAPAVARITDHQDNKEASKAADWILDSLPPSRERDFLLWKTTQGYWETTDLEAVKLLLSEQKIDVDEMIQLANDGFMQKNN
jgi:hypothetical protein